MMRLAAIAALLTASASMAGACASSANAPAVPATPRAGTIELRYDGGVLFVEVAVTAAERAAGLSNRRSLAADGGMLFVYETPRKPSFWMRQTLIPLDIIWIDEGKRVSQIHAEVRPEPGVPEAQLRRYVPEADARYVLELNGGAAARLGIEPGDALQFDVTAP
jgi:hypothetical protein